MLTITEDIIKDALDNCNLYLQRKNRYYVYNIYADYSDKIDYETAKNILTSSNPREAFEDIIQEWYEFTIWDCEDDVTTKVLAYMRDNYDEYDDLNEEDIRDWIRELVEFNLPYDHYLHQEFCANVFVDVGDANYEYITNAIYPHYNGRVEDKIDNNSSIVWLAKQQGYTKTQLKNYLYHYGKDSTSPQGFLHSLYVELSNMTSGLPKLSFLVKLTLEELINLNEILNERDSKGYKYYKQDYEYSDYGYIIIDKNTNCGLYDTWNGGGSLFDIKLDKDVRLPIRYIHSILPDGACGYSVKECYGAYEDWWTNGIKAVKTRKIKKKERK